MWYCGIRVIARFGYLDSKSPHCAHFTAPDYCIHELGTLREEFICAVYGRFVNLDTKYMTQAESGASQGKMRFVTKIQMEFQRNTILEHSFLLPWLIVINMGIRLLPNVLLFQSSWSRLHSSSRSE
jgi:hypothetical protein